MGTQKYPSLMLPNTIKFEHSTICVYSFIYSLAKRQELSVIDVLRQKCALLRSTCPLTEGQSTPKMARRVVRLSPILEGVKSIYSNGLPLGSIHHFLILLGSHSVAKGTLFHQKTTIK
jgi:hypothetical protein